MIYTTNAMRTTMTVRSVQCKQHDKTNARNGTRKSHNDTHDTEHIAKPKHARWKRSVLHSTLARHARTCTHECERAQTRVPAMRYVYACVHVRVSFSGSFCGYRRVWSYFSNKLTLIPLFLSKNKNNISQQDFPIWRKSTRVTYK